MSPLINSVVLACLVLSAVLVLADLLLSRSLRRFLLEAGLLVVAALVLRFTTGFPEPASRQSFGSGSISLPILVLLFVCILVGMAARYVFYLRGRFSWMSFLKPLCVSPIVLLPLLGTLQGSAALEPIQVISFCLLAFQNGFFWRVVFERADPGRKP
ncbi:MAG TPA: hypothetical protein VFE33_29900 [Thermoanaerobaculia bacterium]|nr:hypothetical protein [Thermoanaerobaculia bacterium]